MNREFELFHYHGGSRGGVDGTRRWAKLDERFPIGDTGLCLTFSKEGEDHFLIVFEGQEEKNRFKLEGRGDYIVKPDKIYRLPPVVSEEACLAS